MIKTVYRGLSARKLSFTGLFINKNQGLKHNYEIKQRGLSAKRSEKDL
jgi:hypothetical protein